MKEMMVLMLNMLEINPSKAARELLKADMKKRYQMNHKSKNEGKNTNEKMVRNGGENRKKS